MEEPKIYSRNAPRTKTPAPANSTPPPQVTSKPEMSPWNPHSANSTKNSASRALQLQFAGTFPISFAKEFHGKLFRDEELAFVYIYSQPVDINDLVLQKEEVESVEWFDLEDTYKECQKCRDKFCVPSGGFEVVRRLLREKQV